MGRRYLIILQGALCVMLALMLFRVEDTVAFNVGTCEDAARNAGGGGGNSLMYGACQSSAGQSGGYSPGVGWINNHAGYNTQNYVDLTTSTSTWDGQITIYMHAAQYNWSRLYPFKAINIQLCANVNGGAAVSGNRAILNDGRNNPCDGQGQPAWVINYAPEFTRATSGGLEQWSTCEGGDCGGYVNIDLRQFRISGGCSEHASTCANTVWFGRNGNFAGSGFAAEKISVTITIPEQLKTTAGAKTQIGEGMAYIGESINVTAEGSYTVDSGSLPSGVEVSQKTVYFVAEEGSFKQDAFSSSRTGSYTDDPSGVVCGLYASRTKSCWASDWAKLSNGNQKTTANIANDEELVGAKFCAVTVLNYSSYQGAKKNLGKNLFISTPTCRTIAKKPNVGIAGSNTFVNNGVETAVERKHSDAGENNRNKVYGSWAEFLIVTGKAGIAGNTSNIGTSSGGGLYGGLSSTVQQDDTKKWSPESVGNKSMSGQNVPAAQISASSNFVNQVEKLVDSGSNSSVEIIRTNSITASIRNNQATQKQIIIYSDGDLTISNNVRYIDAWVVAPNGTVDTCAEGEVTKRVGTSMDTSPCGNQLVINGLVYAKGLKLDRTYGGTDATLAEVINLTPASFVWAYNQATSTYANPTTVYVRELAPRT